MNNISAGPVLSIVSLILLGYIFLINHFFKDLDEYYLLIDTAEENLIEFIEDHCLEGQLTIFSRIIYDEREDYFNCIRNNYRNIRRVKNNLFSVSFGVTAILTILVFYLLWMTGLFLISVDFCHFWWILIPIIIITLHFWRKFVWFISDLYRYRYSILRERFLTITNYLNLQDIEIPAVDTRNINRDSESIRYNPTNDPNAHRALFMYVGLLQDFMLNNWKLIWILILGFGGIIIMLLLRGLTDIEAYKISIFLLSVALMGSYILGVLTCLFKSCYHFYLRDFWKYYLGHIVLIFGFGSIGIYIGLNFEYLHQWIQNYFLG